MQGNFTEVPVYILYYLYFRWSIYCFFTFSTLSSNSFYTLRDLLRDLRPLWVLPKYQIQGGIETLR